MFGPTPEENEPLDPAEALMREVGAQLRRARLESGEDVEQVADHLRIKTTYLRALEEGDLSVMPGRAYALGFLRSYADHLGFDGEDLIEQIKSTVDDLTDGGRLHIRTPLPESRLPRTPLVILSLALIGGIYAGWAYVQQSDDGGVETVAEVPDELRRLASEPLPPEVAGSDGTAATSVRREMPPVRSGTTAGDANAATAPSGALGDPATRLEGYRPRASEPAQAGEMPPRSEVGRRPAGAEPGTAARSAPGGDAAPAGPADPDSRTPSTVTADPRAGAADGRADDLVAGDEAAMAPEAGPGEGGPSGGEGANGAAEGAGTRAASPAAQPEPAVDGNGPAPTAREALAALERDPGTAADAGSAQQVHESVNADARVLIRANDRSWVRITSASGDYLRTQTLEAGDVFLVPNRSDLSLWTGNAGALEVIVDGNRLPPLGTDGAVRRDVSLDPERLMAGVDRQP